MVSTAAELSKELHRSLWLLDHFAGTDQGVVCEKWAPHLAASLAEDLCFCDSQCSAEVESCADSWIDHGVVVEDVSAIRSLLSFGFLTCLAHALITVVQLMVLPITTRA